MRLRRIRSRSSGSDVTHSDVGTAVKASPLRLRARAQLRGKPGQEIVQRERPRLRDERSDVELRQVEELVEQLVERLDGPFSLFYKRRFGRRQLGRAELPMNNPSAWSGCRRS